MAPLDIDHLQTWVGRTETAVDTITPRLANGLAAILDESPDLAEGEEAPTCIHWCLSPPIAPMSALGPDGHPARGGFLPPVPLPRRMWAGGALRLHGAFRVGDRITRSSRVASVTAKEGRSGPLVFVAVDHAYHSERGILLEERHDIVYRDHPAGRSEPTAPAATRAQAPEQSHTVQATPTLLMRYSAATFNGHRIHYDRDYAQREEGYPGLVVHGPLQATYLLRLARRMNAGAVPGRFVFRGVSPLFDGGSFSVNGRTETGRLALWTQNAAGLTTMTAEAGAA